MKEDGLLGWPSQGTGSECFESRLGPGLSGVGRPPKVFVFRLFPVIGGCRPFRRAIL